MDNLPTSTQRLLYLFQNEIEQTQQLYTLLKQEYQALQDNEPEQLEHLTSKKKQLLNKLDETIAAHHILLTTIGYPATPNGMEDCLHDLADSDSLKETWHETLNLVSECQKQNEINNQIIALSRRQISNALELLHGLIGKENTYGPSGDSHPHWQPNSLGKA
jgi:flagellar biosynthesis/type III secretory pathway chaperone